MKNEVRCNRLQSLFQCYWPALLSLALLLPSFYWIANDHHVWPWDQAWYGQVSVELWYRLTHHFSDWWTAVAAAFGSKAPGIAWFGQFFTPLGQAMGSMETGLLCSVLVTQFGTLVFAWKIAEDFAPGRKLVVCVGILVFASAPLFVAMSHQYVTEPLQLFGVTYFFFLAVRAHRMQRVMLLGNLLIATAIALLGKATSPIYCLLPGLIATSALFRKRECESGASRKELFCGWFCVIAGLVLCAACAKWYVVNFAAVLQHVKEATSLEITADYGARGTFLQKVPVWLNYLQLSFQLPLVIIGEVILFAVGLTVFRAGQDQADRSPGSRMPPINLLVLASVVHIIGLVVICSLNYDEETRYLLPLLPAVAVIVLWFVRRIRSPWILATFIALLCYQSVAVYAQAFGIAKPSARISYWVTVMDRSRTAMKEVTRIVHKTSGENTRLRITVVGVELPWLNGNTLEYFGAKEELKTGRRGYYTSLGYAVKDMELTWKNLKDLKPIYFITLDETAQPATADFLNKLSIPVLQRMRSDSGYVQEPFSSKLGVIMFREDGKKPNALKPAAAAQ